MNTSQIDKQSQFDINFSDILTKLMQNRLIVAFIFIFCFAIAGFLSYKQVDLYESQLLIQVEGGRSINQDLLPGFAEGMSRNSDPVLSQIFLMQSRYILEPVIETLGLNLRTQYKPKNWWKKYLKKPNYSIEITKFEIPKFFLKKKFLIKIDKKNHIRLFDYKNREVLSGSLHKDLSDISGKIILNVNNVSAPIGSDFTLTKQTSLSMVERLARNFKISQLGFAGSQGTGILNCSLRGENIFQTMKILNTIAKISEQKDIQKRSQEASKTLEFLNKQLPITKGQLENAEYSLNKYRAKSGKIDLKMQSQMLLQKLVSFDTQLEKLELKRIRMSNKYTSRHPAYQQLLQHIKAIENQKHAIEKQLKKAPAQDQVAVNLLRDVSVKKMLYMVFLSKIQELEVVQAGTLSNVHILTSATRPESPIPGKAKLYFLFAAIIASIVSVFYIILQEVMHKKIEDPQWVERNYVLPNLAIIPYSKEQVESNLRFSSNSLILLADSHPRHLTVEALRSLRTNMQVNLATSHNNVIGILGISPGVGKSFVSANIAYLLSVTGKRVLLIDGDLRKGTIHKYLNLNPKLGLAELLSENITLNEAIRKDIYPNLDVIVRGDYPKDPAELLMKNHFKDLIKKMSAAYDIVLFDTAPVLMVTDGLIVGGMAANNYLVLGAGVHEPNDIDIAMRHLKSLGVELKGSIFNFHKLASIMSASYGKYSRYGGYYRNYRAYYADENV